MTITKYDGFAIISKRCDKCNRLFWLEPYNVYYKEVGIEHYSLKQIECRECMKNENQIAKDILHKAIDNTKIAEDVYPNLRKELHKAVDLADMRKTETCNGCTHPCIMYEPTMKACEKKGR